VSALKEGVGINETREVIEKEKDDGMGGGKTHLDSKGERGEKWSPKGQGVALLQGGQLR